MCFPMRLVLHRETVCFLSGGLTQNQAGMLLPALTSCGKIMKKHLYPKDCIQDIYLPGARRARLSLGLLDGLVRLFQQGLLRESGFCQWRRIPC